MKKINVFLVFSLATCWTVGQDLRLLENLAIYDSTGKRVGPLVERTVTALDAGDLTFWGVPTTSDRAVFYLLFDGADRVRGPSSSLMFESNDCSGQSYVSASQSPGQPWVQNNLTPTVAVAPPGLTVYIAPVDGYVARRDFNSVAGLETVTVRVVTAPTANGVSIWGAAV